MKLCLLAVGISGCLLQQCLAEVPPLKPDELALQEVAKTLLPEAIQQIATSDAGKPYFLKAELNPVELSQKTRIPGAIEGWIVLWGYENDIKYVRNPNPQGKATTVPEANSKEGIQLEIFVAYKHGDDLVGRTKNFEVAKNPRVVLGYNLVTMETDLKLIQEIDNACKTLLNKLTPLVPKDTL